jgi:hypothetical protein
MMKKASRTIIVVVLVVLVAGLIGATTASAQAGIPNPPPPFGRGVLGKITAITTDQITIQLVDGRSLEVSITASTIIRSKDQPALKLTDLEKGRWVTVFGNRDAGGKFQARSVVLLPQDFDPAKITLGIGKVSSVDQTGKQFTIETRLGDQRTFKVDDATRFIGGAKSLTELEPGVTVLVRAVQQSDGSELSRLVASRQAGMRFAGKIVSVNVSNNTFTLHSRLDNKDLTIAVDQNTRFRTNNGDLAGLKDLQPGMLAAVISFGRANGSLTDPIKALVVTATNPDQLPTVDFRLIGRVVSADDKSLTISARGGQQFTLAITSDTRIRSRGRVQIKGSDLQRGLLVTVGVKDLGGGKYEAVFVTVFGRLW